MDANQLQTEKPIPQMDWQQVVLNGGPPCFALAGDLDTHYCGRAQRWAGHDNHHKFVSLDDLLTTIRNEERGAAFKVICVDCAEGDTPILDEQARWYYHGEGNDAVGCSASKLRIEAATTKGGNGG